LAGIREQLEGSAIVGRTGDFIVNVDTQTSSERGDDVASKHITFDYCCGVKPRKGSV